LEGSLERDLSRIESQIENLSTRLSDLAHKVARLEQRIAAHEATLPENLAEAEALQASAEEAGAVREVGETSTPGTLPLIGRTLVVLGGAFLLRAITDLGVFPQAVGIAIGLAYALFWINWSDRTAGRGRHASASFHALAGTIIAYPLLWEATVKFGFLVPMVSAGAILVMTAYALAVAGRRSMRPLAWLIAIGSATTALALAVGTGNWIPYLWFILLLGLATLWLGYLLKWAFIGWTITFGVDFTMLLVTGLFLSDPKPEFLQSVRPTSVILLQLSFVFAYFGSFAIRTLVRGRNVLVVEIFQALVVLAIGLGGAIFVARASLASSAILGIMNLLLAGGCYGVSFVFIDRQLGRGRNFLFYTSLALLFTAVAFLVLMEGSILAIAFAVVACFTAWLGALRQRVTLSVHGAVYVVVAAASHGLLGEAFGVLAGDVVAPSSLLTVPNLTILGVCGFISWLPVVTQTSPWGRLSRVPKLVSITMFAAILGSMVMSSSAALLFGAGAGNAVGLAALRTVILAFTVICLAWVGRWPRLHEATWLVYPVLLGAGLKLLIEDLGAGRPSTIFVSLAAYGGALILAPRLIRQSRARKAS
jgi:hypothetical protein